MDGFSKLANRKPRAMRRITCAHCQTTFEREAVGSNRVIYCHRCSRLQQAARLKAAKAINQALRDGKVKCAKGQRCVDCDAPAHSLDHRNYLTPLDVQPVCRSCNWKRGPAIWSSK
jgi:hypothetical protein